MEAGSRAAQWIWIRKRKHFLLCRLVSPCLDVQAGFTFSCFLGLLEKVSSDWTGMSGAWSDPQDFCSAKPRSYHSPASKALCKLPGAWHEASPHCMVLILPANPPQPSFLELPCWGFWHQWLREPCWPLSLTFLKYKF